LISLHCVLANLVFEECQNLLMPWLLVGSVSRCQLLTHRVGLGPLVLFFMQFFEVRHGVAIAGIEPENL